MTYRQLLQDEIYKVKMIKVLDIKKVQAFTSREICIIQALKAYIKLKEILLPAFLDIGVLVFTIFKNLVQKLQLKIKTNDDTKIFLLGKKNKVKVVSLI